MFDVYRFSKRMKKLRPDPLAPMEDDPSRKETPLLDTQFEEEYEPGSKYLHNKTN